jgi:hypothetical protein
MCGPPPSHFWPTCVLHFFPGNPSAHARADSYQTPNAVPGPRVPVVSRGQARGCCGRQGGARRPDLGHGHPRGGQQPQPPHGHNLAVMEPRRHADCSGTRPIILQTHRPHTRRLVLTHGAGSAVRGGQVLLMGRDQSGSAGQGPGALTAAAFAAIVVIVANRRRGGDHRCTAGRGATGRSR